MYKFINVVHIKKQNIFDWYESGWFYFGIIWTPKRQPPSCICMNDWFNHNSRGIFFSSLDRERCRMSCVISHGEWKLGLLFRLRTKFEVLTCDIWFFVAIWSSGTLVNCYEKYLLPRLHFLYVWRGIVPSCLYNLYCHCSLSRGRKTHPQPMCHK